MKNYLNCPPTITQVRVWRLWVLREEWQTIALKNHFHFGSFSFSEAAFPPQKRVLAMQKFLNIPITVTQVRVRWSAYCVDHGQPSL
ncbi:MAG: hypothetical protein GY820_00465 [Gammaproteobacteria bacterium]|nr:hypothetical protein [Gammaproteobacteria bacterium]